MSLAPINVGAALDAGQLGAGYLHAMLIMIIINDALEQGPWLEVQ